MDITVQSQLHSIKPHTQLKVPVKVTGMKLVLQGSTASFDF